MFNILAYSFVYNILFASFSIELFQIIYKVNRFR